MHASLVAPDCMLYVGAMRATRALPLAMLAECAAQESCVTVSPRATRPDSGSQDFAGGMRAWLPVRAVGLVAAHAHLGVHKSHRTS